MKIKNKNKWQHISMLLGGISLIGGFILDNLQGAVDEKIIDDLIDEKLNAKLNEKEK